MGNNFPETTRDGGSTMLQSGGPVPMANGGRLKSMPLPEDETAGSSLSEPSQGQQKKA